MSAYIDFWIRANSGGPFLNLGSWPRSSYLYRAYSNYVHETFKELAPADLACARQDLDCQATAQQDLIERTNNEIEFLRSCVGIDADERLEQYNNLIESIETAEDELAQLQEAKNWIGFFETILEDQEYETFAPATLYISHECNPNYSEKENE